MCRFHLGDSVSILTCYAMCLYLLFSRGTMVDYIIAGVASLMFIASLVLNMVSRQMDNRELSHRPPLVPVVVDEGSTPSAPV